MSDAESHFPAVVVEREFPYPPEKIWRALTTPHLIEEWLMKNEFAAEIGHRFQFRADWGSVDCEVMAVEPHKTLAYSWGAFGLGTLVTWTLTPTGTGTHLRMEQSGFGAAHKQAYMGAMAGWPRFFAALEQVVARLE